MKLYAYYRVSTIMQSIQMQKEIVKKFIEEKGFEIVEEFIDESMSGALGFERPAFNEMYNLLANNEEVDGIVVYNWDRLSREEEFAVMLMYYLRRKNKVVYNADKGECLSFDQQIDRIKTFINSSYNEQERLRIKQRIKDGIKAYTKREGRWGRKIIYGKNPASNRPLSEKSFWKHYEKYRIKFNFSKSAIARLFQISRSTLINRLNESPERLKIIEDKLN